jgi:hypothetical protein
MNKYRLQNRVVYVYINIELIGLIFYMNSTTTTTTTRTTNLKERKYNKII